MQPAWGAVPLRRKDGRLPRRLGFRKDNVWHTTKQKGHSRKHAGRGTYSKKGKNRVADKYDRPYLEGRYNKELEW